MKTVNYYKVWHRALLLSDRSKWAAEVEEAFGEAQALVNFDLWWRKCRPLFEDLLGGGDATSKYYWLIESLDDAQTFIDKDGNVDDGMKMVCFNWTRPKAELLTAFERLLRTEHDGQRGPPTHGDDANLWSVSAPVNVKASMKALDVWEVHRVHSHLSYIELAKRVKVGKPYNTDDANKRVLSATLSRYIRTAQALIDGVEQGVFPKRPQKARKA